MATGSYEGSLAMEGIPDRFEGVPFTRGARERSRRSFGLPTRVNPCTLQGRAAKRQLSRRRERRKTRTKGRDRGVRGSVAHGSVGRQRPRRCTKSGNAEGARFMCRATTRRSGLGRRETPGPPVHHYAEPKTPRGVHAPQGAHGAGNARGAGARDSIGWQTSVRRIARLHCRSIAKSIGSSRALA